MTYDDLRKLATAARYVWAQHTHSHYDGHVADYYAAVSPDVVLALLDRLDAKDRAMQAHIDRATAAWGEADRANAEIAALRAKWEEP